jgi:hypothetical protein
MLISQEMQMKKNQALQGMTCLLSEAWGAGTEVVTGMILTTSGQVVKIGKGATLKISYVKQGRTVLCWILKFSLLVFGLVVDEAAALVGEKVKISPSVVTISTVVKPVGTGTVFVPQTKKPPLEVNTTPSGRVSVRAIPVGAPVGKNVKVSPSKVVVTGVVKPVGTVKVSVPKIISPADEVATTPSGRVSVTALPPASPVGWNVKVSPSNVVVTGVLRPVGTVKVSDPKMMRPAEEVTTTPSGSVSVDPPPAEIGAPVGWNVKVSPSIVAVIGALNPVGTVRVSVPKTITPAEEVITTPSGRVSVEPPPTDTGAPVGWNVNVSESTIVVRGVVNPVGIVKVSDPQISTPAEEVITVPSGKVSVSAGPGLPVAGLVVVCGLVTGGLVVGLPGSVPVPELRQVPSGWHVLPKLQHP